jgi:cell division protein FtsI/penicillin-binding protein 2
MLAGSLVTYDVQVDPLILPSTSENVARLAKLFDTSEASISARYVRGSTRWAPIAEGVMREKVLTIKAAGLHGLYWDQKLKREYPESSLAASLLGFVGKNARGQQVGYYGLEGYYEDELRGISGIYVGERDVRSRPLFFGVQDKIETQDGRDLYLAVDKSIQQMVKRKAEDGMRRFAPKEVCITVADPFTMRILGMSCVPDYDPQSFTQFAEKTYRTSALSDVYEPGSTFKPLIVAAGIDAGVISPSETLSEPQHISVGEYRITNWDFKSRGTLAISDILAKSSNIGMVQIGKKLKDEGVYTSILKYGFGDMTGIDLQGEVAGSVKPKLYWYPIDYATATFGQGIAVTQLQLLTAFSSVINGGELLRPYVVERVVEGNTSNSQLEKKVVRKTISEGTSRIMRKLLEYTVDNAEYRWQKPVGYRFGGKTGTAQIAVAGKYAASKTIASFVGFTPVDKPRFIALVVLKEPSASSWGSETAAPLFFELAKELIAYLGIPPEY